MHIAVLIHITQQPASSGLDAVILEIPLARAGRLRCLYFERLAGV